MEPELNLPSIITSQGDATQSVSSYKYLGFLIDDSLFFKLYIQQLMNTLELQLGFFFRNNSCFLFCCKKKDSLLPLLNL